MRRHVTIYIYAPTHRRAADVAKGLGYDTTEWDYVSGPDDIRANNFHLILNAPLTMGIEYRISVARASGGIITTQEYL